MLQEAFDFRDESEKLYQVLKPFGDLDFDKATLFKGWTINDILIHLYDWNCAASLSITDEDEFLEFVELALPAALRGGLRQFENERYPNLKGQELLETWHDCYIQTADLFSKQDPKARLKWAGADMSARSSITARLMETWAHGQALYDLSGIERVNEDYIKNIAYLGVNTFGWSFKVNKKPIPETVPYLRLTAPSGDIWEWSDPENENRIKGLATEFCQVVAQTRNLADTSLKIDGAVAFEWMNIAQCFAGPPETPPGQGKRRPSVLY